MKDKLLKIKKLTENMILTQEGCCGGGEIYDDFEQFEKACRSDKSYAKDFELHDLICELITSLPPNIKLGGANND